MRQLPPATMPRTLARLLLALCLCAPWPVARAQATPAPTYTVIRVDTRVERLALFLDDDHGVPFHRFDRLAAWLAARGERLRVAMNAGMFEPGYAPVGLFIADGRVQAPLNLRDGEGNFYLKPNGVFALTADGPRIVASAQYTQLTAHVRLATQSGPLLVEHGRIHPRLDPASRSRYLRNGVGVDGPIVWLVISDVPVTLHAFASNFRDVLHCQDALYLDGNLSSLYLPARGRDDVREPLGPILAVVEPAAAPATARAGR